MKGRMSTVITRMPSWQEEQELAAPSSLVPDDGQFIEAELATIKGRIGEEGDCTQGQGANGDGG